MRGSDQQQATLFSYISLAQRVPSEHPLRTIRQMVDTALAGLGPRFEALYAETGRPSIAPERLLRALLLQILILKNNAGTPRIERVQELAPEPLRHF